MGWCFLLVMALPTLLTIGLAVDFYVSTKRS